jgi:hypothetical protein
MSLIARVLDASNIVLDRRRCRRQSRKHKASPRKNRCRCTRRATKLRNRREICREGDQSASGSSRGGEGDENTGEVDRGEKRRIGRIGRIGRGIGRGGPKPLVEDSLPPKEQRSFPFAKAASESIVANRCDSRISRISPRTLKHQRNNTKHDRQGDEDGQTYLHDFTARGEMLHRLFPPHQ